MTVSRAASGVTVLALSGLALLGVASPASAHHRPGHNGGPGSNCPNPAGKYPPGQCNPQSASVNDSSLTPGAPVTYRAQGYMPGAPVVITLFSTPVKLGTATADSFSFVSKALTIPMGTALGSHKLVSTGLGANGRALTLEVPITTSEAIKGAKVKVPMFDGEVAVKVPPGTNSGTKLRVRGKGVVRKGREPGDMYIRFMVHVPAGTTPELERLADELATHETGDVRANLRI